MQYVTDKRGCISKRVTCDEVSPGVCFMRTLTVTSSRFVHGQGYLSIEEEFKQYWDEDLSKLEMEDAKGRRIEQRFHKYCMTMAPRTRNLNRLIELIIEVVSPVYEQFSVVVIRVGKSQLTSYGPRAHTSSSSTRWPCGTAAVS